MKLNLRQVGDMTLMEAEGTPEEIAAFVALIERTPKATVEHTTILKTIGAEPIKMTGRTLVARPPQNGVGSVAFEG